MQHSYIFHDLHTLKMVWISHGPNRIGSNIPGSSRRVGLAVQVDDLPTESLAQAESG